MRTKEMKAALQILRLNTCVKSVKVLDNDRVRVTYSNGKVKVHCAKTIYSNAFCKWLGLVAH